MSRHKFKRVVPISNNKRIDLGLHMLEWHMGMDDPVYAVGSFYVSNKVYPDKTIVETALHNVETELDKQKRMLANEVVSTHNTKDLRKFAGYTDMELNENIAELSDIVKDLTSYMKEDYV